MRFLLPVLFLAASFFAQADEKVDTAKLKHPVKACLFKVEGNGLKKPSYLFGTIHLADPRVVNMHPNAEAAFKEAGALYTEIDLNPGAQLAVAPLLMRKDGKKLTEAIGPELTKKLAKVLADINPALTTATLEPFKTWMAAMTVPMLELQLKGEQPLDQVLYQRAQKEGKKVGALETAKSQLGVFDQFTEKEQQSMLADTLDLMIEDKDAAKSSLELMLDTYLTGDTTEIAKFMRDEMAKADTDPEFTKRLIKSLLDDRNVGMADKAHEFMEGDPDTTHFFAVGAAHYTGKLAVQDLLKKKGYKITPTFE